MGHCGPHPHNSSDDLLFWADLSWAMSWGSLPVFVGHFLYWVSPPSEKRLVLGFHPNLGESACIGISSLFQGISHDDLATNKFIDARTVFGHGVSSHVSGMAAEAVAGDLVAKVLDFSWGLMGLLHGASASRTWGLLGFLWWVYCVLSIVLGQ